MIERWTAKTAKPSRSACSATAAEILPELVRRGVRPDMVTDQTSAHDPINGYLPKGWTLEHSGAQCAPRRNPKSVEQAARASHEAEHVEAMLDFQE